MTRKLSFQLMAGITITLVLMLGTNLWLAWRQQQRDLELEMHGKARVITEQLTATRLFMARNQDRINLDRAGHFEFKGLNPAAVGRGVGAIFGELTDARLKQTRVKVRRPENAPDAFELEALARFEADRKLTEFFQQVEENGKPVFRYAVPLKIEAECLRCHGGPAGELDIAGYPKEGYQLGDIGGAISVALPMEKAIAQLQRRTTGQIWVIVLVTLASLGVIWWLSRTFVTKPMGHLAEKTRDLQAANQIQSQFLSTVSHELRTPLTSIIAFTELLRKQATGRELEYLDDVLDSSRRLLATVNNLLDLNRLRAGRVELFTDVVELQPLLSAVDRTLRPLAGQKSIDLETSVAPGLPLVLVDPHRVTQILLNLAANAVKFTLEGGRVLITAAHEGGEVVVTVADTGPGVAPEHRETIFVAFRRIEAPGTQHQGSGLGLAIARELVELHGGRIWVTDNPGGGSQFRFTLPEARSFTDEEEMRDASD